MRPLSLPARILALVFCTGLLLSTITGHEHDVQDSELYHIEFQSLLQSGQLDLDFEIDHKIDLPGEPRFSPWSYEPVCSRKLGRIDDDQLCVYTSREFGGGRGISLFTTPRIADEVAAKLLVFRDPKILADNGINDFRGNWYTGDVPGKGIGMLAKADLKRGDTVTAYTPVLIAYTENILSSREREEFLQVAVGQLPVPTKEAYLRLATLKGDTETVAQSIASANSFEIVLGGRRHLAVFPEPSRINHACSPNSQFHINASLLTHSVRVARPIAQGEEITIAYFSPLEPLAARQKYLLDSFHFQCRCDRCRRGEAGDEALDEINSLQATLADWGPRPLSGGGVKQAERLIQIYRDEGLDGYLDPPYCHAALAYNAVGSVRGVKKYLELAIEAIEFRLGPAASELPGWRAMLEDPTAHWSWRRRKH